jgi:transposase
MVSSPLLPASQCAMMEMLFLTIRKKEKTMNKITTIGMDLAKDVFHVVCCDARGKIVSKRMLKRSQVLEYFGNRERCLVGMEACASAHYWGRELEALGHEVKLIPAQYVKAFVRGNKNDYNDALAIAEAVVRPEMRFVTIKTPGQQDIQALHRLRKGCVGMRTGLCNQIRGLFRHLLSESYVRLQELDTHIIFYTKEVERQSKQDEACQRLQTIPGFGPIVSSVFHSQIGEGEAYRRGRDASAALGLVPRQHRSAGKDTLLGISKRGDSYLRSLLVHGARAVVSRAEHKDDRLSLWINKIREKRGFNKAVVALANKMAIAKIL